MNECMHELPIGQCVTCAESRGKRYAIDFREPLITEARYLGTCPRCGAKIWPGDKIVLTTDEEWVCVEACLEELEGAQ